LLKTLLSENLGFLPTYLSPFVFSTNKKGS
jgi:hypothetical protein